MKKGLAELLSDLAPDADAGGMLGLDRQADAALVRLARGGGAIDLAIGQALLALGEGDRLLDLGFSRMVDYARERLGVPARTAFSWARLARETAGRPLLRRAVIAGEVSPRKALLVASVAKGAAEAIWTAAAMALSERELSRHVKRAGGEPGIGAFEVETMRLRMSAEQQDRFDAALSVARIVLGAGRPRWQLTEAIAMEWMGGHAESVPDEVGPEPLVSDEDSREAHRTWLAKWEKHAAGVEAWLEVVDEAASGEMPTDAPGLDALLRRLLRARRGIDEPLGRIAEMVRDLRCWKRLGWRSFREYCRERLGMAARTVREHAWLARRMLALPGLAEALASGRITFTKALVVARDASPSDVEERIAEVASTTWQQAERDSTDDEDRRNRAAGERRLWGPRDASETVALAISAAQAHFEARGEAISAGEALARMADHFLEVWAPFVVDGFGQMPRSRREVLSRHGGLCAVPGCSRAAEHEHHVEFRSRGGGENPANRIAICDAHHLRGIHAGRLDVSGEGGVRLFWRIGPRRESWVTEGDDDVRRTG
jgi:hypothetical protein